MSKLIILLLLISLVGCTTYAQENTMDQEQNNEDQVVSYEQYKDILDQHNAMVDLYNSLLNETYTMQRELISDYNKLVTKYNNFTNYSYQANNACLDRNKRLEEYNDYYINLINTQNNYTWSGCKSKSRPIILRKDDTDYHILCSKSMRPTLSCENTLYFCRPHKDDLNIGDIIMFSTKEYDMDFTIHRIINLNGSNYITKGDNNLKADEMQIDYKSIIGKLYKIEG